ncbi:MazG nucleotide pyrophosphohydrolase domain-containing protein, partial [Bacillus safensis]|nr:MazG family protein [Bacillus safensis]
MDPIEGFQLVDALQLKAENLVMNQHILIGQVYDAFVASEVKLTLMEKYRDDYEVTVVTAAGTSMEQVLTVPLYELDRVMQIDNLTSVYVPPAPFEERMRDWSSLKEVIRILRSPEGCPWDRKQTHESLKRHLIEEAHEVIQAIEEQDDHA